MGLITGFEGCKGDKNVRENTFGFVINKKIYIKVHKATQCRQCSLPFLGLSRARLLICISDNPDKLVATFTWKLSPRQTYLLLSKVEQPQDNSEIHIGGSF
jgi:hypothetical protein